MFYLTRKWQTCVVLTSFSGCGGPDNTRQLFSHWVSHARVQMVRMQFLQGLTTNWELTYAYQGITVQKINKGCFETSLNISFRGVSIPIQASSCNASLGSSSPSLLWTGVERGVVRQPAPGVDLFHRYRDPTGWDANMFDQNFFVRDQKFLFPIQYNTIQS